MRQGEEKDRRVKGKDIELKEESKGSSSCKQSWKRQYGRQMLVVTRVRRYTGREGEGGGGRDGGGGKVHSSYTNFLLQVKMREEGTMTYPPQECCRARSNVLTPQLCRWYHSCGRQSLLR